MSTRSKVDAATPGNPQVTKVHGQAKAWVPEFAALRTLCLGSGLNESLKWGKACYDLDSSNVVLIQGFKAYCALLFMKGALLEDSAGVLVQQTPHVQAARQLRFASLTDIQRRRSMIRTYLRQAIAIQKSGATVRMKTVAEFDMPAEFKSRLDRSPRLAKAFKSLTPGRQRAYLLYFGSAKQSATRSARVEKHVARILDSLGLDD